MSWKKNGFSYLTWLLYTIMICFSLMGAGGLLCAESGIESYWGIPVAVIFILAVGNMALLLHRFAGECSAFGARNAKLVGVLEVVTALSILAVGILLRVEGIDHVQQSSLYYDMAKVAEGQRISWMSHGAVYGYVLMLRGLFLLVGNHFLAGIWLQIVLQIAAVTVVYFGVRRLAGSLAAMIVLVFCAFDPYMIGNALVLSPEMLFLCIFAATARVAAEGLSGKSNDLCFFFVGVPMAFCLYMDLCGGLLLLFAIGMIFSRPREERGRRRAALFCLLGILVSFFGFLGADALAGGRSFGDVVRAWGLLYRPESFRLQVISDAAGSGPGSLALFGLMTFGVFGFWHDREREYITPYMLGFCAIAAAGCFGMFTDEMPGFLYLYLMFVTAAGMGVGQCFHVSVSKRTAKESVRNGDGELELTAKGGAGEWNGANEGGAGELNGANEGGVGELNGANEGNAGEWNGANKGGVGKAKKDSESGAGEPETVLEKEGGETISETVLERAETRGKQVRYIENPLPLPKKHVKRVLDFPARTATGDEEEDYDYPVSDEDDFDI